MDYEKAYKAVLQTATQWIKDGCTDKEKICLECVFPELRESEDERIRKIIIKHFEEIANRNEQSWINLDIPYILAYLERLKEQEWNKKPCLTCQEYEKGHKQGYTEGCTAGYNKAMKEVDRKEQKPVEVKDPSMEELEAHSKALHDFKVFAAKQAEEHHISFVHDFEWNNFCGEILSYFNEQKYTPKFKVGDKLMSNGNHLLTYKILEVGHINELGNPEYKVEIFTDGKLDEPHNIHYMECRRVDEWGKLKEQKPAWSEEDDAYRIEAIKLLENPSLYESCPNLRQETIEWLKQLPKVSVNSEQVSVNSEWSEEDELYMQTVINEMEVSKKEAREYEHKTYDSIILWLKSLRPFWKPSKEQMTNLLRAEGRLRIEGESVLASKLAELYEQLKKLM